MFVHVQEYPLIPTFNIYKLTQIVLGNWVYKDIKTEKINQSTQPRAWDTPTRYTTTVLPD